MNASATLRPAIVDRRVDPRRAAVLAAIWLGAALLAVFFALVIRDTTDAYLPRGNDSFYHARRILDAVVGERGFYQFDDRLHVPEGTWIPWPWAYDWLMAKATELALFIVPGLDPMAFISYVPVAWIVVNSLLFMAIGGAIGLSVPMRALAMLCYALSPLTQLLHAIGMIDHHYIEHTFVLLTVWLGLRWFKESADRRWPLALGIVLGAAPAFHAGLFILQLLPLICVFALWLRRLAPPPRALRVFAIALVVTTQLVLLPSATYRNGMFEFGLLSWFHFYVACCTAVLTVLMGRPWSRVGFAVLGSVAAVLAIPVVSQALSGAAFVSGQFSILDQIVEARSPYKLFTDTFGPEETASHYSWLLLTAPLLLVFYAYRALRETAPERLFYAIAATIGLALFLAQLRFHYFGFFAFVTGGLLIVDRLQARHRWHRGATFAATLAAIALAYQPALRERLLIVYAFGADVEYASALPLYLELGNLCAADPGVVLASSDDGNPILFHTDCSVIANNFILSSQDAAKIDEVGRLMRSTPEHLRADALGLKYLLIRVRDFSVMSGNQAVLVENNPIAKQLLSNDRPPEGFTLIKTIPWKINEQGAEEVYARLYKIAPRS
jgi:hypothetical protein